MIFRGVVASTGETMWRFSKVCLQDMAVRSGPKAVLWEFDSSNPIGFTQRFVFQETDDLGELLAVVNLNDAELLKRFPERIFILYGSIGGQVEGKQFDREEIDAMTLSFVSVSCRKYGPNAKPMEVVDDEQENKDQEGVDTR